MGPQLSIVVPFYDVEHYIADCLDSIARQTFRDFEVVLVDDGSRDASAEIARRFCAEDSRFRIVTQDNQGLGPARNTGAEHAVGEYLTFVDSDDLVTRHAYERLVATLERSGSSLAGGDARRFDSSGVRESYVHRVPFATDRLATHVTEVPALVLDRMIWNKVFRRSFWDEFGYRFPAIRYEDYPVTLKAHLDAVTVDCLAAPVYYWRVRELSQSITQQSFSYENLLDRVVSAEMVLEIVEPRSSEVRSRVHRHLAQIDLITLVQAFATAEEKEEDPLVRLGHRLTSRLDRRVLSGSPTFDLIQFDALRAGDVALLRRLADFRNSGGLRGGARARRQPGRPWRFENQYPGLNDKPRTVPRRLYRLPRRGLALWTSVSRVSWTDTHLLVRGGAEIRHLPTSPRSQLQVSLLHNGVRTPCELTRFMTADSHGDQALVGFEARISRDMLARLPRADKVVELAVEMTNGRIRRRGVLRGGQTGSPTWSPGAWVGDDMWVQPRITANGRFVLVPIGKHARVTGLDVREEALVVSGVSSVDLPASRLVLGRSSGVDLVLDVAQQVEGDTTTFTASIPVASLVDATNPDDPFTQTTSREVRLRTAEAAHPLLMTHPGLSLSHVSRSRLLRLTRSPAGLLSVHEGPVRLFGDRAEVDPSGTSITISGRLWDPADPPRFLWRRLMAGGAERDIACETECAGERWSATVTAAAIAVGSEPDPDAPGGPTQWTLFASDAGGELAVLSEPWLASQLPMETTVEGRRLALTPRAGAIRVEVR